MKTLACILACGLLVMSLAVPIRGQSIGGPATSDDFVLVSKIQWNDLNIKYLQLKVSSISNDALYDRMKRQGAEALKAATDETAAVKARLAAETARADKAEARAAAAEALLTPEQRKTLGK
jgi:hypothetical protein